MLTSKETVHLGVLDEWDVVDIDKIESHQPLQMYSRVGRRADRFLRRRLKAYTPATLTDPGELRQELLRTRGAGHALDNEEFAVGLKCIAAPLRDHTRRVVASLGIAGRD